MNPIVSRSMIKLPVIVGLGGMNPAGRTSGFHSYKRMVHESLSVDMLTDTWQDLAHRMGIPNRDSLTPADIETIKKGTLIRRIESYDPQRIPCNHKISLTEDGASFVAKRSKLSEALLSLCETDTTEQHDAHLKLKAPFDLLIPDHTRGSVSSAGSIPSGFDPGTLYASHHHPRGLKLAVYGASDALNSLGLPWEDILKHIHPDEVAVYAGSGLAQIDENSLGGLIGQPLNGHRINSKMLPLSFAEMPADFVNSYVINSVGATGNNMGACASFLYNLRLGMQDIQYGKAKIALVGNAEAPIVPEVVEGFRVMGALATDESLCALDQTDTPNHRRACRPFSTNSGFTLAESVQFFVLMEDELALKLGLTIYGSVADVFVNADANKKSIASPGVGNYITVAKATALAKAILGEEGLKEHTYVQAHGTGTPQNRTTESHLLNEVAKTFGIEKWPVTAVKSYIGHSISVAAGDQLAATLGVWQHGWIPGIKTIDHIASDVYQSHLNILQDHLFVGEKGTNMRATIINSKGFGGNNASALILSPQQTQHMLQQKYGQARLDEHKKHNKTIQEVSTKIDHAIATGHEKVIYRFGEAVMDQTSVSLTKDHIRLSEFAKEIPLIRQNPYRDYT